MVHPRYYWLEVDPSEAKAGQRLTATVDGQAIELTTDPGAEHPIKTVSLHLLDRLIDLDHPVTVTWNGVQVFEGLAKRTRNAVERSLASSLSPDQCGTALLELKLE